MKNKGLLIAFEGIDGTGKSSQLQLLATFLREKKCKVVVTREPTDSKYGKLIRQLYTDRSSYTLKEELELFIEDRRLHVDQLIQPGLSKGYVVLTDRYYFSTAAYQGAAGINVNEIFQLNSFAPIPDRVILLTMDPEISMYRIQKSRGDKLNDFEHFDQLKRVADLFAQFEASCIRRVDASLSMDVVQQQIRFEIDSLLEEKKFSCP